MGPILLILAYIHLFRWGEQKYNIDEFLGSQVEKRFDRSGILSRRRKLPASEEEELENDDIANNIRYKDGGNTNNIRYKDGGNTQEVDLPPKNSDQEPEKDTPLPQGQAQLTNHRIRWDWGGRCTGSKDKTNPVVAFCDPLDRTQNFDFSTGNMIHNPTGRCLRLRGIVLLLGACGEKALRVRVEPAEEGAHYLKIRVDGKERCISPSGNFSAVGESLNGVKNVFISAKHKPCLQDRIVSTPCNEMGSGVQLIEETVFQEGRRHLNMAELPGVNETCNFRACAFEKIPIPSVKSKSWGGERCKKLKGCVTVIGKTVRRPLLVLQLAESLRKQKGDLPIIFVDDGPDNYPSEIRDKFAKYPLLKYIVSVDTNLGMAAGRNLALAEVITKYTFVTDDDTIFLENSDLERMVEILETTDAAVVGGGYSNYADRSRFSASFLQFSRLELIERSTHYKEKQIARKHPYFYEYHNSPRIFYEF